MATTCGIGKCAYTTPHPKRMVRHRDIHHAGEQPGQDRKDRFRGHNAPQRKKKGK